MPEAAPTPEAGRPGRPAGHARGRRGYFLPGTIALLALLAIGGAVGAGDLSHPAPHTLSGNDVASEIALGIESAQGLRQPPSVSCPTAEPVRAGLRFTCTEAAGGGGGGAARPVAVTEIDNRGHLRWSLPSAAGR